MKPRMYFGTHTWRCWRSLLVFIGSSCWPSRLEERALQVKCPSIIWESQYTPSFHVGESWYSGSHLAFSQNTSFILVTASRGEYISTDRPMKWLICDSRILCISPRHCSFRSSEGRRLRTAQSSNEEDISNVRNKKVHPAETRRVFH
jgi:hypothetical protein